MPIGKKKDDIQYNFIYISFYVDIFTSVCLGSIFQLILFTLLRRPLKLFLYVGKLESFL